MTPAAPLDTTIAVVTPENISFQYQLAGPFRRAPAYVIDVVVRWSVLLLIWLGLLFTGLLAQFSIPPSFLMASAMIGYFLITWFYGTAMEAFCNGRTVGKWTMGLRVLCTDGKPIDGTRALVRNLVRAADLFPYLSLAQWGADFPMLFLMPTGILGMACMVSTRRMQRLGDLAAGTMVVIDERSWQIPVNKVDDPRAVALATYIPKDYRVSRTMARTLATYAERRSYLSPGRRREVAKHLAQPLIERFEFRPEVDPDLLLLALYHNTFLADPRDPPPELGKLAGFSPLLKDAADPPATDLPVTTADATADAKPIATAGATAAESP